MITMGMRQENFGDFTRTNVGGPLNLELWCQFLNKNVRE